MEAVTGADVHSKEMPDEIKTALGHGALVVTGNERSARTLRRAHDAIRQAAGSDRWEPATVMSWSTWTASLWRQMLLDGHTHKLLLNAFQEHAVWQSILGGDDEIGGLRGVEGLAQMAAETWTRLCSYAGTARASDGRLRRISSLLHQENGTTDLAAFARWARKFEELCSAEGLLTAAALDAQLEEAFRSGLLLPESREILLVGFDRMTPTQEALLASVRSAGTTVVRAQGGPAPIKRQLAAAADEAEELRACAHWAAAVMARKDRMRLAVIVPDLSSERASIERVFREVLAPELESIAANEAIAPYEFSLGRPLAEMPMVSVALELLRWAAGAIPLKRVGALLVSDYFAAPAGGGRSREREARAEFDAFDLPRTRMLRPEMSLVEMARKVAGSKSSAKLPGLLAAVRRMERTAAGLEGVAQSYGEWAQRMRDLLAGAGWGTVGAETSEEFQVRERWESALDAMSTLDFRGGAVEYADALKAIERIAKKTTFAPESRSAQVQVMGPLEAAGSEFDAVWFMRAGELSWQPAAGSLPLMRWALQRDLGMPGTDAERDGAAAKQVMERICASGSEVVISYARISGEAHQKASAIVRNMGLVEAAIGDWTNGEPERIVVPLERVEDTAQIRPLPDGVVSGGVRVLELQAACGFRAFAEQRLFSKDLESRTLGLNSMESGTIVHKALECFWAGVRSQAALIALTAEERAEAVARSIEEGLQRSESTKAGAWDEAYLQMQRERLRRLLEGWLEVERRRPSFEVLRQEEELRDVMVGPLRFKLRMDRVDLVDEVHVLIDYKTGAATTAGWTGDRPDAPQVPLYAVLAARGIAATSTKEVSEDGRDGIELGGVAFGNVRAGEGARLHGFAAREGLLPGKMGRMEAGTFAQQVNRWSGVLERLAAEFAHGDARVQPKNYPETCLRCGQRVLCRLDASLLEEIEAEDETVDGNDG